MHQLPFAIVIRDVELILIKEVIEDAALDVLEAVPRVHLVILSKDTYCCGSFQLIDALFGFISHFFDVS